MTMVLDGLYQYGGVPVGVCRLQGIFESDNIWFVDGYVGAVGNPGTTPAQAKALPSEAIILASGGGMIYIRPIGMHYDQTNISQNQYYADDIIIPYTKGGINLIGAGVEKPHVRGGAAIRPTSDNYTGSLIQIRSNSNLIENLCLTLNGATAHSGTVGNNHCIIEMQRSGSTSRCYGNVVRNCRFQEDKSHPDHGYLASAIGMDTAQRSTIINNSFDSCVGGITISNRAGDSLDMVVRGNTFGGLPATRSCDITVAINSSGSNNIIIADNIFADGKPTHEDARFIIYTYITAGTGIIANNYFATATVSNGFGETSGGSQAKIAAETFMAGNYYQGSGTTAPYGLITT